MKVILGLIVLNLCISCGMPLGKRDFVHVKGQTTKQHAKTDTVFSPYVSQFENQAKVETGDKNFKVGDVPVNFGDTTDESFDGACLKYADGTKEVMIKKSWWDNANSVSRRIMVFHELGHCRLGRTHDDSTVEVDGQEFKTSIMHPVIPDSATFQMNEDGYLTELYTQSKNKLMQLFGIES